MKSALFGILICSTLFFQGAISDQAANQAGDALMKELGGRLKAVIQADGPIAALETCNLEAMPLTEKVSREQGILIDRITDKPRNPANMGDKVERELLRTMVADHEAGRLQEIYRADDMVYKPILIKPLCLTCHGENLAPEVGDKIKALYPSDMAVGYKLDEVRGAIRLRKAD